MSDHYDHLNSPGYRWDREDKESLYSNGSPLPAFGAVAIPDEIDPRGWLVTENQGPMGSCRGHSLSTGCEFIYRGILGEDIRFSSMWCYLRTQKRDGLLGSDRGSTIENGVKVAVEEGVCTEAVFPYPNPVRYSTKIPAGAAEDAARNKFGRYSPIENYDDAKAWIGTGQGYVDIGVKWPFQHSGGRVTQWVPPRGRAGGHAMAFCGYLKTGELILFNSHGERSGDRGEFIWTPEAFNAMCRDSYSSVIGLSDMKDKEVKPREINFLKTSMIR
jgi:hypothetical protein